jgi:hypothetical protein
VLTFENCCRLLRCCALYLDGHEDEVGAFRV